MGICKCKKKSEDFCYNHKKFICNSCVVTDHSVCHIDTYVNWLTNSEFQNPICEVCKSDLTSDEHNAVRLGCYHVFHPECIDVYANSLPANTASAGYGCPICFSPIIPKDNDDSPLALNIKHTFSISPWAEVILSSFNSSLFKQQQQQHQQQTPLVSFDDDNTIVNNNNSSTNNNLNYYNDSTQLLKPLDDTQTLNHPYGAAIRKQQILQQQTPASLLQNNEYGSMSNVSNNSNSITINSSSSNNNVNSSLGNVDHSIIQFDNNNNNTIQDFDDDKYNKKMTFSSYFQNQILTLKEKPLKLIGIIIIILFFLFIIFRGGSESNSFDQPIDNNKE